MLKEMNNFMIVMKIYSQMNNKFNKKNNKMYKYKKKN